VTLATALVSLFSGRPARADTAMTGELTLTGLVLPVGGIKEKLIAAQRAGLARVLIPARNAADVAADVPAATRDALRIIPCATMADVLREAFEGGFPEAQAAQPAAKL
jgi:ATP-dependent Lon protease